MSSDQERQGQQAGFLERARQSASHDADALILTCIDYRFPNLIVDYMESLRPKGQPPITYDQAVLAGGALGVFNGVYPSWPSTFWDHLAVSLKLHRIKHVYLLDHQDCGGYREFGALPGTDQAPVGSELERQVHQHYMDRLAYLIKTTHPDLEVHTHLLALPPGKTENRR